MLSKEFIDAHDGVFVVTVTGYDDRQEHVTNELGAGNFEFVYGVDKSDVTKEQLIADGIYDERRAIELSRGSKPMKIGGICCAISHSNVYRLMVERNISRALIFEDDILIRERDDEKIRGAINDIPPDAEFIYWDWSGAAFRPWFGFLKEQLYFMEHRVRYLKFNPTMIRNMYPRDYNESFMIAGRHYYADAYTLTLECAKKLLEMNTPVVQTADDVIMHASLNGKLTAYLSRTLFFEQRSNNINPSLPSLTGD